MNCDNPNKAEQLAALVAGWMTGKEACQVTLTVHRTGAISAEVSPLGCETESCLMPPEEAETIRIESREYLVGLMAAVEQGQPLWTDEEAEEMRNNFGGCH